jgi:hypothetical protein
MNRDKRQMVNDSKCIACGCTDSYGCDGGCSWLTVDRELQIGICSNCNSKANAARYDRKRRHIRNGRAGAAVRKATTKQ